MIYELPGGAKMIIETIEEPYFNKGRLCTPEDPKGEVCQVMGCSEIEAIGVLFTMYYKMTHPTDSLKDLKLGVSGGV